MVSQKQPSLLEITLELSLLPFN
uniref:Uncharacterized protein n=1 Tax=Arundo donax TaxID=35708 RepID=A0A0A8ZQ54_ARUDO